MAKCADSLSEDKEFYEASLTNDDMRQALNDAIVRRKQTIRTLEKLKKEVEESYDKSRKAQIGGTVATVTGSALGITGFGLGFFTFGLGFGLCAVGGVLGAAGGATIAGSQIGYYVVSSTTYKNAQSASEDDIKEASKIEKCGKKLDAQLKSLAKRHGTTKEGIMTHLQYFKKHGKLIKNIGTFTYNIGRGADVIGDTFRITQKAITAVRAGTSAATAGTRLTRAGLRTVSGVLRVGGVVLDVVFIPIDIGVMIKSSYDVHKYKTTGESNSNVARDIGDLIIVLTENLKQMEACKQELETEIIVAD